MSTNDLTTHSLRTVLSFPFRGAQWQNRFFIGVGLSLAGTIVPIAPAIFLWGYFARLMRQAMRSETLELPAWDDWEKLALEGLRVGGAGLIYMLPSFLIIAGGLTAYFVGVFGMIWLSSGEQPPEKIVFAPLVVLVLIIVMALSMLLGYLLLLVTAVILPVALARCVEEEKFSAAFHLRAIHETLWRNKSGYFVAWVILMGLFAIFYLVIALFSVTMVLSWVALIPMIPFGVYLMMIAAVLFGQTYGESVAAMGGCNDAAKPPVEAA